MNRPTDIYSRIKESLCKIVILVDNGIKNPKSNYKDRRRLADNLLKLIKSFRARADFAPIIYSNWGYDGLIAYYLSHAAKGVYDVTKPVFNTRNTRIDDSLINKGLKKSPEKTGYLLYMKILYEVLSTPSGKNSSEKNFMKIIDDLISLSAKQQDLLEILEYIKRYTEILAEPIIKTLEESEEEEREKIINQIRDMFCNGNTNNAQKRVGDASDQ
ncbi:MAG: hypothetical protein GXO43_07180 [Crenarchaeota archaeon]|nr:hypothetical protein [Thermoproteota archaeon]